MEFAMSTQPVESQSEYQEQRRPNTRLLIFGGVIAALLLIIAILSINSGGNAAFATSGRSVLVWIIPVFLVGVVSFLSPCTLPILPAYFAFTFQASRKNIVLTTVAFFLGLATTMTLLGAITTAVSAVLFQNLDTLTFWGGLIVIGFGVMSMLGKGFAGPQMQERPAASVVGSYLYGATFALGWTACVGPILGGLLTLLASQGIGIIQGGILSFIYALGMGTPLILLATFFSRLGPGSRFWQIMRGRGFEVRLGSHTLHLHSTSVASGVLLIAMGWLLASGQLTALSAWAESSPMAQWMIEIESAIGRLFGLY
jgi:cytochrome c-type biogenesis protein